LIGISLLVWVVARADFDRLQGVVAQADMGFLLLVPLAIAIEQLVRAWKWRQLLHVIRPIGTLRLFGAIMAGYLAGMLIPLGVSPLVRSWLVARLEALKMSSVLATAAIDRLVDGVVFTGFVAAALIFAAFPDPTGDIRGGLIIGGGGGLALFGFLLVALARFKRRAACPGGWIWWLAGRLPARFSGRTEGLVISFAEGIVWPRGISRGLAIVLASVVIKLVAVTHFLWAGLAFGVVLRPADYVFLVVFLGFLIVLTRFARSPGGFLVGALFALDLLGVDEERALAMTLAVQFASIITIAGVGAFALWRNGMTLGRLRTAGRGIDERA
jgi:hypothetical protein